ncbi:MAG: DUF6472 family protein [Faecalibacterium sp.]
MRDLCECCANNALDEEGYACCSRGDMLDEDEMARYLSRCTSRCPFFEPGDEYDLVRRQN